LRGPAVFEGLHDGPAGPTRREPRIEKPRRQPRASPERCREHRAEGQADGTRIVLRHPGGELQHAAGHHGDGIGCEEHRLEVVAGVFLSPIHVEDDANEFATAYGHDDPRSPDHSITECRRNGVAVGLKTGNWERDRTGRGGHSCGQRIPLMIDSPSTRPCAMARSALNSGLSTEVTPAQRAAHQPRTSVPNPP